MTIGLLREWEATGGPPPGDLSSWGTDAFTQGQHQDDYNLADDDHDEL